MSEAILTSWRLDPWLLVVLTLIAWLYTRGWRKMHRQSPWRYTWGRLLAFFSGLWTLFVALASPLDAFGNLLLEAHMVQHLLLVMVAAPLLLLGQPVTPFLRGLPTNVMKEALGPFLRAHALRAAGRAITHPVVCWCAMTASIAFWHMPRWYDLALRSAAWHRVEHAIFFYSAILFWWPVIGVWPGKPRWSRWLMIPYLVLADMVNSAVAAWLVFSSHVVYQTYAAAPRLGGIAALDDQSTAGAIMWVPGSIAYLVPAFVVTMQALNGRKSGRRNEGSLFPILQPTPSRRPLIEAINRVARIPWIRPLLQMMFLFLALAIVIDGFRGPQVAPMNLAGVLPWTWWRGLMVIALLCAGNLVCMVCPFTLPRRMAGRFLPAWPKSTRPWPRKLRNKWLATILLLTYLWACEVFRLWGSPWLTACIVVGYFAAAFAVDVFFTGDSFCKYVCPIGQFNFVGSMISPMEVKVRDETVCSSCVTYDCARHCGMKLFAPAKAGNFDCTFCLECIHACPKQNIGILPVLPGSSPLAGAPKQVSAAWLAWSVTLGALVNAALMVDPVMSITHRWSLWLVATTGYLLALTVAFLLSRTSRLRRHSFALVPLGFSMWLAHFGYHFAIGLQGSSAAESLRGAQITALDFGLILSLYIAWRKSERSIGQTLPWALGAVAFYGVAVWTLFQPMEMRGMLM